MPPPRASSPTQPTLSTQAAPSIPPSPRKPSLRPPSQLTLDFALLRGALEEIPIGVATTRGGALLYANEALMCLFGAKPGGLENKHLADLFAPNSFARMSLALEESRVFDGRVIARALDGRDVEVDAHVEWYSSEAQGTGGFIVVRDLSLEAGTLRRLVEQLGGALFRVRVPDGALEGVSPTVARLTGLDAAKCAVRPVLLTTLVSSEERERIAFLYRRMAKGDLPTANAQVSLRRPDGVTRVVQLRAAAHRDTTGVVRYIEGVIIDAARDPDQVPDSVRSESPDQAEQDPVLASILDLTYELLRETSQHLNVLFREVRAMRATLKAHASSIPPAVLTELTSRLDSLASAAGATTSLTRGVRHALARGTLGATLGEVLEGVRNTLSPTFGDRPLTIDAGDVAGLVIAERSDELTLAITHLALRAFRFAGSGSLRITARRTSPPRPDPRTFSRGSRPPEREHAVLEILGSAPPDIADAAVDISSDMLRTVPRPDEADHAYTSAQALIVAAGGLIESDDATFSTARSVIRLSGG